MVSRFKIFHHDLPRNNQRLAGSCIRFNVLQWKILLKYIDFMIP